MSVASSVPLAEGRRGGFAVLFTTEMGERFSFYGMRGLLLLYLLRALLLPGHVEHVWGFADLRRALEALFGPMSAQALSSQIVGLYAGLVYLTPIAGGLIADRYVGARRTVVVGCVLMAAGHILMAFEPAFLLALGLLIIGTGAFKPNISAQVGRLFPRGDPRADRAYTVFYLGINIGAFAAPLVCGTLGETIGWHWGFAAAGAVMMAALAVYLVGLPSLPPDPPFVADPEPADAGEARRAIFVIAALFAPVTLFWAVYSQIFNVLVLWTEVDTDRSLAIGTWRATIPTTWFQTLNPLMIFAFTPLLVGWWRRQGARGREPGLAAKMAIGCGLLGAAHLVMALAAWSAGGQPSSWLWLVAYNALLTLGELYLSPIGLALVAAIAPTRLVSLLMGLWLSTNFTGGLLAGWVGTWWDLMSKPAFFLLLAGTCAVAAACIAMLAPRLTLALVDGRRRENHFAAQAG